MQNINIIRSLFLLLILNLAFTFTKTEIIEVSTLDRITEELPSLDENSLVIFDIDGVLLLLDQPFYHPFASHFLCQIFTQYLEPLENEKYEKILSIMLLNSEYILIDKSTPSLTKNLQERLIKTIALTAASTGSFGLVPNLEAQRINDLKKFDIDFGHSFPEYLNLTLESSNPDDREDPLILFKQGIIFTNHTPKDYALSLFFSTIKWKPNKIIFIDDEIRNLELIEQDAKTQEIEFLGLHYTAAQDLPYELDEEVVKFQFDHLVKTEEWLNTEEATKIATSFIKTKLN